MPNDQYPPTPCLDNDTTYGREQRIHQVIRSNYKETLEEQPFDVVVTPDARVASLEPTRHRPSPRSPQRDVPLPQTSASSARQSRSRLMRHVVGQSLRVCMTLTYRVVSRTPDADLTEFIKDAKAHYPGGMEWASVTEGGTESDNSRLHHHVFLPMNEDLHKVASEWVHGDIHVGININDQSLRRAVNYVAKRFVNSEKGGTRYRRSRARRLIRIRRRVVGLTAAVDAISAFVDTRDDSVRVMDPRCGNRRIVYWDNP